MKYLIKPNRKLDTPLFLQGLFLTLFAIFPIALSIIAQALLIINSWDVINLLKYTSLVFLFLLPIIYLLRKNLFWNMIEENRIGTIIWVVSLAIILRIVILQILSTDFVSDMEDVYFFAIDLNSENPLANVEKYANIPYAPHLNMTALILSFVFRLFGASTSTAKLFVVALGGVTTFLLYITGEEVSNGKVGFLAAFFFATLPSVICFTGVLTGDYFSYPFIILAVFVLARENGFEISNKNFYRSLVLYALIGILIGLSNWFRPLGVILIIGIIISFLTYQAKRRKIPQQILVLSILLLSYTLTSNLAIKISEDLFKTNFLSPSQRISGSLLKGLNPGSKGTITMEDDQIVKTTYEIYGDNSSEARKYLIGLALSRLDSKQVGSLLINKFTLIWSSHNALFDYALAGSNDQELVDILRAFEALLYLVISIFIFFHTLVSIYHGTNQSIFVMQLFVLGYALLLLLVEVQNRYVVILIPYSLLLGTLGMNVFFHKE